VIAFNISGHGFMDIAGYRDVLGFERGTSAIGS
jgi:predicted alternative tryptophan synthase beta-subunit